MLVVMGVSSYGNERNIYSNWGVPLVLGGPSDIGKVVALELNGTSTRFEDILANNPSVFKMEGRPPRHMFRIIGKKCTNATLDDIMKADDLQLYWMEAGSFTLEEYSGFLKGFAPALVKKIQALVRAAGEELLRLSKEYGEVHRRFDIIMNGFHSQNDEIYYKERLKFERKLFDCSKGLPLRQLFIVAGRMETSEIKYQAAVHAYKRVFNEEKDPSAFLWELLKLAKTDSGLAGALACFYSDNEVTIRMRHQFDFPHDFKGQTVEIHSMQETDMQFGVHLLGGKFVGPVKLTKKVLWDREKNIYVFGGNKLKQKVARKGGKIEKFGNTIVTKKEDVDTDLLAIERIDAFSCINPALISEISNRKGKKMAVPQKYVDRIKKDYRVGRELADLALEELFGIDPDIARMLYRSKKGR
jgi:hypothetical protein